MWLVGFLLMSITHIHADNSALQALLSQKGLQKGRDAFHTKVCVLIETCAVPNCDIFTYLLFNLCYLLVFRKGQRLCHFSSQPQPPMFVGLTPIQTFSQDTTIRVLQPNLTHKMSTTPSNTIFSSFFNMKNRKIPNIELTQFKKRAVYKSL